MERCRGKASLYVPEESNSTKKRSFKKKKVTSMSRALHSSPLYSHMRVVSGCLFWKLPIDLDTNVVSSYFKINVPFGLGKCAITYWFQGYNKNLEMDRYWIFFSVVCPPSPPKKENCRSNDSWSEARVGKLGLVNFRKDVWDCYRGQVF